MQRNDVWRKGTMCGAEGRSVARRGESERMGTACSRWRARACSGEGAVGDARLAVATPEGLGSPPCVPSPHHLPRVQALGST